MKLRDLFFKRDNAITLKSNHSSIRVKIMNQESIDSIKQIISNDAVVSASEVESFLGKEPKDNIHAASLLRLVHKNKVTDPTYRI